MRKIAEILTTKRTKAAKNCENPGIVYTVFNPANNAEIIEKPNAPDINVKCNA